MKLKTIAITVAAVLVVMCMATMCATTIIVVCNNKVANYSRQINELQTKLDELLGQDPTINFEPDINIEIPGNGLYGNGEFIKIYSITIGTSAPMYSHFYTTYEPADNEIDQSEFNSTLEISMSLLNCNQQLDKDKNNLPKYTSGELVNSGTQVYYKQQVLGDWYYYATTYNIVMEWLEIRFITENLIEVKYSHGNDNFIISTDSIRITFFD